MMSKKDMDTHPRDITLTWRHNASDKKGTKHKRQNLPPERKFFPARVVTMGKGIRTKENQLKFLE